MNRTNPSSATCVATGSGHAGTPGGHTRTRSAGIATGGPASPAAARVPGRSRGAEACARALTVGGRAPAGAPPATPVAPDAERAVGRGLPGVGEPRRRVAAGPG